MQATLDAAGKKFVTPSGSWMESWMGLPNPLSPASTMSLAWLERMARLLLDIVRSSRSSDLVLGGAWISLVWMVAGRAEEVAVPLIEAGLIAETVTSLRKSQPSEWISLKSPKGIVAASIFAVGWTISTLTFANHGGGTLATSWGATHRLRCSVADCGRCNRAVGANRRH